MIHYRIHNSPPPILNPHPTYRRSILILFPHLRLGLLLCLKIRNNKSSSNSVQPFTNSFSVNICTRNFPTFSLTKNSIKQINIKSFENKSYLSSGVPLSGLRYHGNDDNKCGCSRHTYLQNKEKICLTKHNTTHDHSTCTPDYKLTTAAPGSFIHLTPTLQSQQMRASSPNTLIHVCVCVCVHIHSRSRWIRL